jgi:hypothetical protein
MFHIFSRKKYGTGRALVKKSLYKTCLEYQIHSYTLHIFPYMTPFSWRLSLLFSSRLCCRVSAKISFLALLYAFNNRRCRPPHSSEIKTHNVFKVRVLNFYVKALGL